MLEFYYDIVCPYAYIASTLVEDLAGRHDGELSWKPVLLGGLLKAHGAPDVPVEAMPPAKARHSALDVARWAERRGVELTFPDGHPMRTVDAMRLLTICPDNARAPLSHALYRAYWVQGRRVDDLAVLLDVANSVDLFGGNGGEGAELVERLGDPDVKLALRNATDAAVDLGIFGVPTFIVRTPEASGSQSEGLLFWGQDRVDFVDRALAGESVVGFSDLGQFGFPV